ncbi:hypothetical protein Mapa_016941 [Marchantia paleacea]|nr:hypothetical protein Mapa_016941 [Marchantia paleacea]
MSCFGVRVLSSNLHVVLLGISIAEASSSKLTCGPTGDGAKLFRSLDCLSLGSISQAPLRLAYPWRTHHTQSGLALFAHGSASCFCRMLYVLCSVSRSLQF